MPLIAADVKEFFEDPAFLLGLPLLVLGVLGALVALSPIELRRPERMPVWLKPEPQDESHEGAGHPSGIEYLQIGLILAVITAVEVGFYYIDLAQGALMGILLVLSAAKFVLVVLWFMHLKFDSRIFSVMFSGGLALVATLFAVVLLTLGAGLI